jgi:4-methyl-5(b-hydroxyethyl)-thiazole monophosphate biosynthesis
METPPKTALVIVFDGVEEVEAVTPIDLLRRAGVEVTVAAPGARRVTGRTAIAFEADMELEAAAARTYDALVLPGGPGVKALRSSRTVRRLIEEQAAWGRLVAAICAAPLLLKDAGALAGRRYTAHFSAAEELPDQDRSVPVVRDGSIVTSRGAGTSVPFALAIVASLLGPAAAAKVAEAICHPH